MADPPGAVVVRVPASREEIGVASEIRSTLVLSSVQSLRARGLFDGYVEQLDPALRALMLGMVAGVWIPMPVGLAHYRACDALKLTAMEQTAIGHDVGERVQGTVLGVMARAARSAGATPWTVLGQTPRLWDRVFGGGGGVEVRKVGPKDARVEFAGLPLLDVAYFRHSYCGAFLAGLEPFCQRAYVKEDDQTRVAMSATYHVSWA